MKNVQISEELFKALLRYHLKDAEDDRDRIRRGVPKSFRW